MHVYNEDRKGALEPCAVLWEEVDIGRHGFGDFRGEQAWRGHTILQNWHVGGGSKV